jgi:hypothetical protein
VTGGKTILITPKMNFVGGTVLHTTESGLQETMTADGATAVVTQLDDVASSGPEGFIVLKFLKKWQDFFLWRILNLCCGL